MKTKCSVYIAASLDGFIARPDGDVDWLDYPEYMLKGEDFGYYNFMDSIDALIMGRNTYEKLLTFGEWHYEKPVFVLSSKELIAPDHLLNKVFFLKETPQKIIKELNHKDYFKFYIDGGKIIQSFLKAELLSEITITQIPILLGDGIPLFASLGKETKLKLISSKAFENGFVKSTYQVLHETL